MSVIEKYLAELPQRLDTMDFIRLDDEQVADIRRRRAFARASSRLEGVYFEQHEILFKEILLDKRVPADLKHQLSLEFLRLGLGTSREG